MSNANKPEPVRMYPDDVEQLLREHRPRLEKYLRAAFPRMQPEQIDEWLQHLAAVMLGGVSVPLDTLPRLWTALKRDVLDSLKRHELVSLESLAAGHAGDSSAGFQPPDLRGWSPASLAVEKERLERRERLLSDVLCDYVAECEQSGAWNERELMERLLRGQSRKDAAREMGISMNQLNVTMSPHDKKRGRFRLQKLMQQKDVHRSVFATYFGGDAGQKRDKRPLPDGVVPYHQASVVELIGWLIDDVGAMCPSDERLIEFAATDVNALAADPTAFRDVRYHVHEAKCVLCQVTLAVRNTAT